MRVRLPTVVANTDERWFNWFRPTDELTRVDEVNFWRPSAQNRFRQLDDGEPFFFRLKRPFHAIAGFGFYAGELAMSVGMAWEIFGQRNGDPDFLTFQERIGSYRSSSQRSISAHLSCIVLRDATFLPSAQWIPWRESEGWPSTIMAYKGYDLAAAPGHRLGELLRISAAQRPPDLSGEFELIQSDTRAERLMAQHVREGQGAFRVRLMRAYEARCAVTGEHSMPVLDAAHIQPYMGPASNHIKNGLLMRTDLHKLYDAGYVTVTPDLEFIVSRRLRDEFENGRTYYQMEGKIRVPANPALQPSSSALEWHASHVFR